MRGKPTGQPNTHCGSWVSVPYSSRYNWRGRLVCTGAKGHEGEHCGADGWSWTAEDRTPRRRLVGMHNA